MAKHVLVIGATSAVGEAIARQYAGPGALFSMMARNAERLDEVAFDLEARGSDVRKYVADIRDRKAMEKHLATAFAGRPVDLVICAHGVLGDNDQAEESPDLALEILDVNFQATALVMSRVCHFLEAAGRPSEVVIIGSVAGDRGRPSNYFYGSAKAGIHAFAQGLRARYFRAGIHVMTVKPGFLDTPMTAHLPKNALFVTADFVAGEVASGLKWRRHVIYVPGIWRLIMAIIRSIPEMIFKRLSL